MQSNQNTIETELNVIDDSVWEELFVTVKSGVNLETMEEKINTISYKYNIDRKNILKYFLNYMIRNKREFVNEKCMNFVENIMHFQECKNTHYINYFLLKISNNI
jgi:hypothetical protein